MTHDPRVQDLNDHPAVNGRKYVLYWVQASPRTRYNHALEHAVRLANERGEPLAACFGLTDNYPEANERSYLFLLQGLADLHARLREMKIAFVVRHGSPAAAAIHYAKDASVVVCDRGYTRLQRRWRDEVADACDGRVVQIETDVVVPVEVASDKHEFAARTIRPKIHRAWEKFLVPLESTAPTRSSLRLGLIGDIDVTDVEAALAKLKIDRSVGRVKHFVGGETAGQKLFAEFLARRLDGYAERRNEPSENGGSTMSMYLHFGHVSPLDLALAVRGSPAPRADRDSYLEELIVRRELSMNYAQYVPDYDAYAALPAWARKTLDEHRADPRPTLYSRGQLEAARTADPYWNAAQTEMLKTGFMHNYMRMYWGKRFLEWTVSPEAAFAEMLYLNNKYFLCGRGPNAFANVAWVFGLHDRPWGPARKIFGTVRYMNAAGLERKFDMKAYVRKVGEIGNDQRPILNDQ